MHGVFCSAAVSPDHRTKPTIHKATWTLKRFLSPRKSPKKISNRNYKVVPFGIYAAVCCLVPSERKDRKRGHQRTLVNLCIYILPGVCHEAFKTPLLPARSIEIRSYTHNVAFVD